MPLYEIAGLKVSMNCKSPLLTSRAAPYKIDDGQTPDVTINITDEDIRRAVSAHPEMNENEWEYMLFGSAFYRALTEYDGLMLHASAVVVDGRAYLFSAPCGTGKSTHTGLWLKLFGERAYIINDDKPAIRLCGEKIKVYGTPFSGKHDISKNTSVDLGGICFIARGEQNIINPIDKTEAIINVIDQTVRRLDRDHMDKMLTTLDKIISRTTVYKLECNMELSAAKTAYEAISGEKFDG